MSNIAVIENDIYGARSSFASVLTDPELNFEREAGFAIQTFQSNDFAAKIAMNNRQSVVNAVTNIAAIGISLNPAKRQAYLVPRDGRICLDISYMGLMDLAMSTGSILWAQAELVYAQDQFALNGFDKPPTHTYNPFAKDRGEIVGVYVVVKTAGGDYLTTCMSKDDIDGIMKRSQSFKSGKSSPWTTDYGEMAKKTVVKRAYKYWPKTDRLDKAIHHLNTDSGEGLAQQAQQPAGLAEKWMPQVIAAGSMSALESVFHAGRTEMQKAKDVKSYSEFKQAVEKRKAELAAQADPIEGEVQNGTAEQ
ncbi:recombinase RecT [Metapseudomonas otitidis]|uniref:recombinase RecT n=1 Tax=Metapseudomonas otitidis TaxID=319939 RepID=UPI00244AF0AC|nr:recombinase RecT [Pseudomonas otitidis]MDH0335146.1 recombinase RecT [Pseudomonas otitidis]